MEHAQLLNLAIHAAKLAGDYLCNQKDKEIIYNYQHDIKIKQDKESETIIIQELTKATDFPILSEESTDSFEYILEDYKNYLWIVDPLDGTMNYFQGIPFYCISIALWRNNQPVLGVIYDFKNDVIHSAIYTPAENKPITTCADFANSFANSIICTGFPSGTNYTHTNLSKLIEKIKQFKKIRMLGSAAMSLALVAEQKAHVYCERAINIWDVAAGLALVKAKRGNFFMHQTPNQFQYDVVAGSKNIPPNLLEQLII